MSLKDKVRGNIYKSLLENEKKKNKRLGVASVGLFIVGVCTSSLFHTLTETPTSNLSLARKSQVENYFGSNLTASQLNSLNNINWEDDGIDDLNLDEIMQDFRVENIDSNDLLRTNDMRYYRGTGE